ncbi:MAG: lysophospholipid acyltransferase family protein [Candidatus Omnitrophota bacterium]|jgi:KDO2-lipid IV(A) lauroyltransferase
MDSKRIRKNIEYFFSWLALAGCSFIFRFFPYRYLYGFADSFASVGYSLFPRQRKIALESLTIAFGKEKNPEERERIAKACFVAMAKSGFELIYLMERPALLKQRVRIEGLENLEQALRSGKGVILVSAHFGNFPLLLAKLSQEGYTVGGIMRPMRNHMAEKLFDANRAKLGIKTIYSIPRNTCVHNSIRSLRDNELVFIPLDQNFGTGGVFVEFFGRKAATATGPVILARRTGAAIVPCFIIRQKDDTHKLIFEQALSLEAKETEQASIAYNVQKITHIIESYIRFAPEEWGWIHRRWKSTMKQEPKDSGSIL